MDSSADLTVPRRSTRIGSKKVAATQGVALDNAFIEPVKDLSNDDEEHRPTKRRRTARMASRKFSAKEKDPPRKRGQGAKRLLSKLPEMPLDILFEILSQLHPLDLLHCARASKTLRDVLMRKSSRWIWIQALKTVEGLPECPADMSEPEFVNLVFDPHCHFCLNARVLGVLWRNRVRCCKNCVDANLMDMAKAMYLLRPISLNFSWFHAYDVITVDECKQKAVMAKSAVLGLYEKLDALSADEDKCKTFVAERKVRARAVEEHAISMETWQGEQLDKRAQELDRLRNNRQEAIKGRLRDLGFEPELDDLDSDTEDKFQDLPSVKQPKELTDRIWNNIKGPIIELMERARQLRIAQERCMPLIPRLVVIGKICAEFVLARPNNEVLPRIADFCVMPEIMAILHSNIAPSPALLDELRQKLPNMSERWRQESSQSLLALLPDAIKKQEDAFDLSPLNLATTIFQCDFCYTALQYPRLLTHECMTRGTFRGELDLSHTPKADILNVMQIVFQEQPWRVPPGGLAYSQAISGSIADLVRLCDKEPQSATAREMDDLDVRFICRHELCKGRSRTYTATWRTAHKHAMSYHRSDAAGVPWQLLDANDIPYVKDVEARERHTERIWSCKICRDEPRELMFVKAHIRDEHNIAEPLDGEHYYSHPGLEPGPPRTVIVDTKELKTVADEVKDKIWMKYPNYSDGPFPYDFDFDSDFYDSDDSDDDIFPFFAF